MESCLRKNIDDLEAGHRDEAHSLKVTGEDEKEDPLDFVLWKPKKEGEPSYYHLGAMEDLAGILNVLLCLRSTLLTKSISMREERRFNIPSP